METVGVRGGRGVTLARLTIILLAFSAVFYILREARSPRAQSVYSAGIPQGHISGNAIAPPSSHGDGQATCRHLPGAEKVLVLLKTGATELYEKLPTHLVTTFQCTPQSMIFSDLDQSLGDIRIHDAIAPVSEEVRRRHGDFALYRELGQWQREGQDVGRLKGASGWNLDKWKFLPMLHHAFEAAEKEIEWFVLIEADTSLSWLNLLLYLRTMDPRTPYYLGAQNQLGHITFAHGGSGIVISRAAADELEAFRYNTGRETYDSAWEENTAASCCGDAIVAEAFLEAGVPLSPAWPLIQGEEISTVDFTQHHWCAPAVTWHHVTPVEVDAYWQFERHWAKTHGWERPYLYRDIFAHFVEPLISADRRARWNNLSRDTRLVAPHLSTPDDERDFYSLSRIEQEAVESEQACERACREKGAAECVQWMFQPGRCHLGRDVRLGKSDDRGAEHWTSGWLTERVDALKARLGNCEEVRWSG